MQLQAPSLHLVLVVVAAAVAVAAVAVAAVSAVQAVLIEVVGQWGQHIPEVAWLDSEWLQVGRYDASSGYVFS